jgi:hypothetical protein
MIHARLLLCVLVAAALPAAAAVDPLAPTGRWTAASNGTAPTPPMGWNSWNAFHTDVDEDKVLGAAQVLVDSGLSRLGYVYVNIDDGWWSHRRESDHRMQIRTTRFPSAASRGGGDTSFRPLTDRLHGMGLKAGIYSDLGRNTCGQAYEPQSPNLPTGSVAEREVGLFGHVEQDIATYFQDWGFDYIKVDACGIADYGADRPHVAQKGYHPFEPIMFRDQPARSHDAEVRSMYAAVAEALARARPKNDYVLSICNWGIADVRAWGPSVGTSWRTSDDIYPDWSRMLHNFDSAATRALYAHPGAWNDPDMLFVGTGDFDEKHLTEARSHFALWAMIDAPLLIGYDLRHASPALLAIWGNPGLVAINQDPAGNQAVLAYRSSDVDILVKRLASGAKAVAILNRDGQAHEVTLTAGHLKFDAHAPIQLRDAWQQAPSPVSFTGEFKMTLAPHETRIFMADGTASLPGRVFLSELPARVHVARDGVVQSEPDPEIHRNSGWTTSNGVFPMYPGWGGAQADASPYSTGLAIAGHAYASGIGILANSRMEVRAERAWRRFSVRVGVDDATRNRTDRVQFSVYGDGRLLAQSGLLAFGDAAVALSADIPDIRTLELVVTQAHDPDHPAATAWADAAFQN